MYREPGLVRPRAGIALRFLIQSHALLSYLSALGAHRAALHAPQQLAALHAEAEGAASALDALASYMEGGSPDAGDAALKPIDPATAVEADGDEAADHIARLFRAELAMVRTQIESLRDHAGRWMQPHPDGADLAR